MQEIFESPSKLFEAVKKMEPLLVSMRMKVLGCPYSIKYINPRFIYDEKCLYITADNLSQPLKVPLYLLEEVKVRWEMFGARNGQRMVVSSSYYKGLLPDEIWNDVEEHCSSMIIM